MSVEDLSEIVGVDNVSEMRHELDIHLGTVTDFEVAVGGLVHHVFRMKSHSGSAYLKIRGNFYAGLPDIPTQPELIENEKRALDLFAAKTPEYFPSVIAHSPSKHYLLLSDIMPGGLTLDKKYSQETVSMSDLWHLGRALGDIHASHADTPEAVRQPDDKYYQSNLMKYALESYEHPLLIAAAEEHKTRPTQLLVGDLSPKNTYIENGVVRLCDLENAHQGAIEYDQAFALAHVLLHRTSEQDALIAMRAFLDGYQELGPTIDETDALLNATLHGILLYRLDNRIIPYSLPFSEDRKRQMIENVYRSLDQNTRSLEEVTVNLFRG